MRQTEVCKSVSALCKGRPALGLCVLVGQGGLLWELGGR